MDNETTQDEGTITVSPTGDVVIGAPTAIAIFQVTTDEEEE